MKTEPNPTERLEHYKKRFPQVELELEYLADHIIVNCTYRGKKLNVGGYGNGKLYISAACKAIDEFLDKGSIYQEVQKNHNSNPCEHINYRPHSVRSFIESLIFSAEAKEYEKHLLEG